MSILDNITEEEYEELEITIHEVLYDKLHDDILTMSSPNFHNNMVDEISELIHDSWLDAGLCDEDDYEDIYDLMFQITESFFDIFEDEIPRRSYICTQYLGYFKPITLFKKYIPTPTANIRMV